MISARMLAISITWAVLSTPLLWAGVLTRYREFQFGMNLPAVVKLVGMNSSEARVIHQRPELIQELDWQPGRFPGSSPEADPVKGILFSFCNGELYLVKPVTCWPQSHRPVARGYPRQFEPLPGGVCPLRVSTRVPSRCQRFGLVALRGLGW